MDEGFHIPAKRPIW